MTGLDPDVITAAVRLQTSRDIKDAKAHLPPEYEIADTSHRVVKLILGTAKLSHIWDNIKFNDLA
jgi:UDP-N-acetyl-L-fucosamine synthase